MLAVTVDAGVPTPASRPDPEPGTGQLLVAVRAAGLNAADLLQLAGHYPAPPDAPPDILGLELAGEVVAVGPGVTRFATGDRVMAVVSGGAQAELALVHERAAMPLPEGIPWEEGGGFPEAFTTAHDALFTQAGLELGERLVVHGAAGGVGLAGVQLGVASGASVVATVRRDGHVPRVAALGAEVCRPDDWVGRGPFDVVLELVGAPNLADDLDALATGGRIVVIGVGAGARAEIDLRQLMGKRGRLMASTLRARPLEGKAAAARAVEAHVLPLLRRGVVKVPVHAAYPLTEAQSAYEDFRAGGKLGKIVLTADTEA